MPTLATLRQRSCAIWVVDSIDLHKIMMRGGGPKRSDSGSRSNWPRRSMYAKKNNNNYNFIKISASVRVRPRPSASVRVRRIHKAYLSFPIVMSHVDIMEPGSFIGWHLCLWKIEQVTAGYELYCNKCSL